MENSGAPAHAAAVDLPSGLRPALAQRLLLTGRDAVTLIVAPAIGVLLCGWLVVVTGAILTVLLPLLAPTTGLVRACCEAQRRWVSEQTGRRLGSPYRATSGTMLERARTVLTDPASWRDATWMLWHSIVGWVTAALSVCLLLGSVFYLTYPLWYAVAPPPVFREPFGPWSELHSVAQSCALIPVSLVLFALWYAVTVPMSRAQASVGRMLLSSRRPR